jgi:hypothetical protein
MKKTDLMAWATLSIPPFSRQFARLGHRFDELSKRDRFLRPGTMFLISIPLTPRGLLWVISGHLQSALGQKQTFRGAIAMSALPLKVDILSAVGMSALGQKRT